ncbi:MAG: DUF4040 domain-containing protein [Planctomycetes bacterium]|nr:DUF4040 domain-containing protein [Planctomycetota bacterium]
MGVELVILLLIVFMIISALIAVEASDLLSAVIAIGAAGFALCAIDLLLAAPDLAFPQVLVEIITLVILIRMIMTRQDTSRQTPKDTLRTAMVMLACGMFLIVVFLAVGGMNTSGTIPSFGRPVMGSFDDTGVSSQYLFRCAQDTGAANVVMGILLDYRAYDTLGEATVIVVAILGGYAVLRRIGRKKREVKS